MCTSLVHSLARDKNMFYFCRESAPNGGGAMRFSYAESMTDPSFYGPLARAAEEAGYHSMVIPDSICYPRHSDSVYPFNPDGTRDLPPVKIAPVPAEPIPVLIGGHSGPALRRAARLGDGWMHGGGDPADLPRLLARLGELRRDGEPGPQG